MWKPVSAGPTTAATVGAGAVQEQSERYDIRGSGTLFRTIVCYPDSKQASVALAWAPAQPRTDAM